MVTTLGNNIINAYTGGVQVKEIYSFGVKVWPVSTPGPANNQIFYTSSDNQVITPYSSSDFGANVVSNTYSGGLGVITFDGPVLRTGYQSFLYASNLRKVQLPSSVTEISTTSFAMTGLTEINIPNGVTHIYNSAFDGSSLSTITIPQSVTFIGVAAFRDCSLLDEVIVNATVPPELQLSQSTTNPYSQFVGCSANLKIKVPPQSLNAYLTATGWSDYASYIVAMPDDSIDFSELGLATATSVDYDDYGYFASGNLKITFSSTTSTKSRYYTGGTAVRIYGGNTMSIESIDPSITFKKIEFTWTGTASTSYEPDTDVATPSGYDYQTYVWTGNSGTVEMTKPTGSGHWRIKAVSVWYS